jgi:hypothetical protein
MVERERVSVEVALRERTLGDRSPQFCWNRAEQPSELCLDIDQNRKSAYRYACGLHRQLGLIDGSCVPDQLDRHVKIGRVEVCGALKRRPGRLKLAEIPQPSRAECFEGGRRTFRRSSGDRFAGLVGLGLGQGETHQE